MTDIKVREAVLEDAEILFAWRNDPFLVSKSSSQKKVQWDGHLEWFKDTIEGDYRKIYVVCKEEQPIGQIRFDLYSKHTAIVSAYLSPEFIGKGWGKTAIHNGCLAMFFYEQWNVQIVIACIRSNNAASQYVFLKVGFEEMAKKALLEDLCPDNHIVLLLSRSSFIYENRGLTWMNLRKK